MQGNVRRGIRSRIRSNLVSGGAQGVTLGICQLDLFSDGVSAHRQILPPDSSGSIGNFHPMCSLTGDIAVQSIIVSFSVIDRHQVDHFVCNCFWQTFNLLNYLQLASLPDIGQLGEDDQRTIVVCCNSLFIFGLTLFPSIRNDSFYPLVLVALALFIHLRHTDSHSRPVVGLVQDHCRLFSLTVELDLDIIPVLAIGGLLELHGHSQTVVHISLAVHKPLLGDRNAELAGGIGVHYTGLGGLIILALRIVCDHLNSVRQAAQVGEEGHLADFRDFALAKGCAVFVLDLGHGVLAHRDAFHRDGRGGGDGQGRGGCRQRLCAIFAGQIVGRPVDHGRDLDIEGAVLVDRVRACHLLTIDEHVLVDDQGAEFTRICDREGQAVIRQDTAVCVVRPFGGHAVHRRLHHGEVHAGGQAHDGLALVALNGQGRNAVRKGDSLTLSRAASGHAVLCITLAFLSQISVSVDGELILPVLEIFFNKGADDVLVNGQVCHLAGVGEVGFADRISHNSARFHRRERIGSKARHHILIHGVGGVRGQARNQHTAIAVYRDISLQTCSINHKAHVAVGRSFRRNTIAFQEHDKSEVLIRVGRIVADDLLADQQVAGLVGIGDRNRLKGGVIIATILIDGELLRSFAFALGVHDLRHPQGDIIRLIDGHHVIRVVPGDEDGHSLVDVVGDGWVGALFMNNEGIFAGLVDAGDIEEVSIAGLQRQGRLGSIGFSDGRRVDAAAVADLDVLLGHAFGQREARHLHRELGGGVAAHKDLLHRHAGAHGVVDQLGQEDQIDIFRHFHAAVFNRLGLDGDGLANREVNVLRGCIILILEIDNITSLVFFLTGLVSLHPAVAVADARRIHLIHADSDRGPVVLPGQLDDLMRFFVVYSAGLGRSGRNYFVAQVIVFAQIDVLHIRPNGLFLRRIACGPLQLDIHHGVFRRGGMPVDQPLLGHRDAVFAGSITVDKLSFRRIAVILQLRGGRDIGDTADEGPAVQLAVFVGDLIISIAAFPTGADVLGYDVLAERELPEDDFAVNGDAQVLFVILYFYCCLEHGGIFCSRTGDHVINRVLFALFRSGNRTGHSKEVFDSLQECVILGFFFAFRGRGNLLVVQEHVLGNGQFTRFSRVHDADFPDAGFCVVNQLLFDFSAVNQLAGFIQMRISRREAFRNIYFNHEIFDLMTVVVLGQVLPQSDPLFTLVSKQISCAGICRTIHNNVADKPVICIHNMTQLIFMRIAVGLTVFIQVVNGIPRLQTEGNRRFHAFFIFPYLGRLDFNVLSFMLVGQAGDIDDSAAVCGAVFLIDTVNSTDIGHGFKSNTRIFTECAVSGIVVIDGEGISRLPIAVRARSRVVNHNCIVAGTVDEFLLHPAILNHFALGVKLINTLDHMSPVIGSVQIGIIYIGCIFCAAFSIEGVCILRRRRNLFNDFPLSFTVFPFKLNLDRIRPDSIAVIPVIPLLCDGNTIFPNVSVDKLDDRTGFDRILFLFSGLLSQISGVHAVARDSLFCILRVLNHEFTISAYFVDLFCITQLHEVIGLFARLGHGIVRVQILQGVRAIHLSALGYNCDRGFDNINRRIRLNIGQGSRQLPNTEVMVSLVIGITKLNLREIDLVIIVAHHSAPAVLPHAGDGIQFLHDEGEDLVVPGNSIFAVLTHALHVFPGFKASLHTGIATVMTVEMPFRATGHHTVFRVSQNPASTVLIGHTARVGRKEQTRGVLHVQYACVVGVKEDVAQDHIVHCLVIDGVTI